MKHYLSDQYLADVLYSRSRCCSQALLKKFPELVAHLCKSQSLLESANFRLYTSCVLACSRFLVSEAWPIQRRIVLLPYGRGVAVIVQMYSLFHLEALHSLLLAERLLHHLIVTIIVSLLSMNLQTKTDTAMAEQLTAKLLSAFEVCLPELYICHVQSYTPPASLQTRIYWFD